MLFNSLEFLLFLPIVFFCYWFVVRFSLKLQNIFLIGASYFFYGWWDWRFLSLIVISSIVDFFTALLISRADDERFRKLLLAVSILVNLGILATFKYYNFFIESFLVFTGGHIVDGTFDAVKIIFPIGISFYTFQTIGYTVDVYRRKVKPSEDIIAFFAFVSFFPQLVAGPIERARSFLPQFTTRREFNYNEARDGLRQVLWGFFTKLVIADNCGRIVDVIHTNSGELNSIFLLLGAVVFAGQIYWDFAGYSDIAIGIAKLFGFRLSRNFAFPIFSRTVIEFWERWHITLTKWIRDYFSLVLPRSRKPFFRAMNIMMVFVAIGLWHGPSWKFIIWGGLNGLYFLWYAGVKKKRYRGSVTPEGNIPSLREVYQVMTTIFTLSLINVMFRATSIWGGLSYYYSIIMNFNTDLYESLMLLQVQYPQFHEALIFLLLGILIEWFQRKGEFGLQAVPDNIIVRWAMYALMSLVISNYFIKETPFIYFQF